ncbi:gephyrin-like molybdotransferase Glp [Micropruina sp.]|uniref:molybdopterin molybdotransferase MoeA n=1 Tax=Micropruina sp. TaxID=2737536 RepID=UPI0026084877|nr:gephyrin-like molybdotransferase Glp [Micropruina sp.]
MALFGRKKQAAATVEQVDETASDQEVPASSASIGMAEYRAELLAAIEPLRPIGLGVLDAFGRRLCEDIVSDIALPTFTSAATGGYAVRAADVASATPSDPVRLPVLDTLDSPAYRGAPLLERTAIRVALGAPVPEGADAVVALDRTDGGESEVRVDASVAVGQHLRLAGSDIADGTLLLERGRIVDAGAVGLLAEVGLDKVLVRQSPRVAVLTIGSDLVPPGLPLTSRLHRYDATSSLIAAGARADGAQVFAAGTLADDAAVILEALTDQLIRADLVVVVGGLDGALPDVLERLGELRQRQVTVHPGGTHAFAVVGDDRTPVIALPAGVWPAFVGYHAFVRPALNRLQGEPNELPVSRVLPARVALHGQRGATELIPAVTTGRGVEPAGDLGADLARDVARADALIVLPPGTDLVPANSDVEVWMLTPART